MAKTTVYTTSDIRELPYRSGESVGFPNEVMARIKKQGGRFLTNNKDGTYSKAVIGKIHKKISNQYQRIKEKVNKSEKKDKIKRVGKKKKYRITTVPEQINGLHFHSFVFGHDSIGEGSFARVR